MSIMPVFGTDRRSDVYGFSSDDAWDPSTNKRFKTTVVLPHAPPHHKSTTSFAAIEWKESPEAYFLQTELPGVKREDIKVVIEDDKIIKISGERNIEKEDNHDNGHHVERGRGKFTTAFMLPEDARVDQVRSSMKNGKLSITVPKKLVKHHARPVEITI